jgi:hypothetical protein
MSGVPPYEFISINTYLRNENTRGYLEKPTTVHCQHGQEFECRAEFRKAVYFL